MSRATPRGVRESTAATRSAVDSHEGVVVGLDHDAREVLRSRIAKHDPSEPAIARSASRTTGPIAGWARRSGFSLTRTLINTCGNGTMPSSVVSSGDRFVEHGVDEEETGQDAVSGRAPIAEDHVPRLLAAQDRVFGDHPLEHVLVADRRAVQPDALVAEALFEPEVAHDGRDDRVAGQRAAALQAARAQEQDVVAVDHPPAPVDREAPVGVAVEREPQIEASRANPRWRARRGGATRSRG